MIGEYVAKDTGKGEICYQCGHVYEPAEPIYYVRVYCYVWATKPFVIVTYCGRCAPQYDCHEQPCDVCRRPVHRLLEYSHGRHCFCSAVCRRSYYGSLQRDRRQKANNRECATCGETFQGTRSDSRYCSSACRQRAYRHRQAVTANGTFGQPTPCT